MTRVLVIGVLLGSFTLADAGAVTLRCSNAEGCAAPTGVGVTCNTSRTITSNQISSCTVTCDFADAVYVSGGSTEPPPPRTIFGANNCSHSCAPWGGRIAVCQVNSDQHVKVPAPFALQSANCVGRCSYVVP